jgi:hypothetical protein
VRATANLELKARNKTQRWICRLVALVFVGTVMFVPSARAQSAEVGPTDKAILESVLDKSFGPALEAVTSFEPYSLTGDFNGDGAADVLIVVRIKGIRWAVPKDVTVIKPFYKEDPTNLTKEQRLGIAIIHGGKQGWQNSAAQTFLLFGESPILILEDSRANATRRGDRQGLMELVKKRGRRSPTAMRPPATAKGDSVSLPTEAADSILYWNGKTYRWVESEGGE